MKFESAILFSSAFAFDTAHIFECTSAFCFVNFHYWLVCNPCSSLCRSKTLLFPLWLSEHELKQLIRWIDCAYFMHLRNFALQDAKPFWSFWSILIFFNTNSYIKKDSKSFFINHFFGLMSTISDFFFIIYSGLICSCSKRCAIFSNVCTNNFFDFFNFFLFNKLLIQDSDSETLTSNKYLRSNLKKKIKQHSEEERWPIQQHVPPCVRGLVGIGHERFENGGSVFKRYPDRGYIGGRRSPTL